MVLRQTRLDVALVCLTVLGVVSEGFAIGLSTSRRRSAASQKKPAAALACGTPLAFQVLLDRRGFSSGEIDGKAGENTRRALAAFQEQNGVAPAGELSCESWNALDGDETGATTSYTISAEEASAPLTDAIPADLVEQSKLARLDYTSLLERVAERFHASPALIQQLNRSAKLEAGASIIVPSVEPFDVSNKPARDASAGAVNVEVTREGTLRVLDAAGRTVFLAPASSGSEHDPLPAGSWKVTSVTWMPVFNYNPDLFWDADEKQAKATIKPGPNNPVGVLWVDINVEHYGLHGTPEPSHIGYKESHGCVRLTNWDAARLAALVGVGTPVIFK